MNEILSNIKNAIELYNTEGLMFDEACTISGADPKVAVIVMANESIFTDDTFVNQDLLDSRRAKCTNCEYFAHALLEPNTCSVCNCYIGILATFINNDCPKGFWQ